MNTIPRRIQLTEKASKEWFGLHNMIFSSHSVLLALDNDNK